MHPFIRYLVAVAPFAWACATFPAPSQRLADTESLERRAEDVGANSSHAAQVSLRNTQAHLVQARRAMADGQNQRADALLRRAQADGELTIAQARERTAQIDRDEAARQAAGRKLIPLAQGRLR